MRATYDQKLEAVDLCRSLPAETVREVLGLVETPRTIQRWANQVYGRRPTHRELERRNPLRERVVALMEARGLDEHECSMCLRGSFKRCYVREVARDQSVESLIFVCSRCVMPGDC